jgi:hypothetical protein
MSQQMPDPGWSQYRRQTDDDHIRTLVILHRVFGGITAAGSCCLLGYITFVFGIIGLSFADKSPSAPPAAVGGALIVIWVCMVALVSALSILNFLCANWLRDRRNWMAIAVVSAINCLHMPLGTALGVFTLIVINRQTVRETFQ